MGWNMNWIDLFGSSYHLPIADPQKTSYRSVVLRLWHEDILNPSDWLTDWRGVTAASCEMRIYSKYRIGDEAQLIIKAKDQINLLLLCWISVVSG